MSYQTVEVDLDRGHVRPSGSETLPEKARALLTILTSTPRRQTRFQTRRWPSWSLTWPGLAEGSIPTFRPTRRIWPTLANEDSVHPGHGAPGGVALPAG